MARASAGRHTDRFRVIRVVCGSSETDPLPKRTAAEGDRGTSRMVTSSKKIVAAKAAPAGRESSLDDDVQSALAWLERKSTKRDRENLARFGITASKAFGVSMANIQVLAKRLGRNHELAAALWETGWYEARMLTVVRRRAGARHARADGPLVPRLRQLGHLRHAVLPPLRPHAARLGQGRAVERRSATSSSSARPLRCSPASPGTTRRRRRAVRREPAPHRARRHRRTELRQEGRELGPAHGRQAQRRAQRRRGDGGPASGGLAGARGALGGEGRAQGAHEPCGSEQARPPAPKRRREGAGATQRINQEEGELEFNSKGRSARRRRRRHSWGRTNDVQEARP